MFGFDAKFQYASNTWQVSQYVPSVLPKSRNSDLNVFGCEPRKLGRVHEIEAHWLPFEVKNRKRTNPAFF